MKQKGQGLVEFAIVAPILIFFLIGVFEVGWALRGYLILANANREAARFAVREATLDFNQENPGYEKIVTHTIGSISQQLDVNFQTRGTMIVSFIEIDAPCTMPFTITTPLDVPTYTAKFPITSTQQTLIDYQEVVDELLPRQVAHSCDLVSRGLVPFPHDLIIVEMWYEQPQLLGFPLISNPFTDPVPMYTHTMFRKAPSSRD